MLFNRASLPAIEKAAEGEDDNKTRYNEGPEVGHSRGGADGVRARNHPFTS